MKGIFVGSTVIITVFHVNGSKLFTEYGIVNIIESKGVYEVAGFTEIFGFSFGEQIGLHVSIGICDQFGNTVCRAFHKSVGQFARNKFKMLATRNINDIFLRCHMEFYINGFNKGSICVYFDLVIFINVTVGDMANDEGYGIILTAEIEGSVCGLCCNNAIGRIKNNAFVILDTSHREGLEFCRTVEHRLLHVAHNAECAKLRHHFHRSVEQVLRRIRNAVKSFFGCGNICIGNTVIGAGCSSKVFISFVGQPTEFELTATRYIQSDLPWQLVCRICFLINNLSVCIHGQPRSTLVIACRSVCRACGKGQIIVFALKVEVNIFLVIGNHSHRNEGCNNVFVSCAAHIDIISALGSLTVIRITYCPRSAGNQIGFQILDELNGGASCRCGNIARFVRLAVPNGNFRHSDREPVITGNRLYFNILCARNIVCKTLYHIIAGHDKLIYRLAVNENLQT